MPIPAIAAGATIAAVKAAPHVAKAAKVAKAVTDKSGAALLGKVNEYFLKRGLAGKKLAPELMKYKGFIEHYTEKGKQAAYNATMKSQKYNEALRKRAESE